MTPEEREQLRRDLEAAGCPELAHRVKWSDFGDFSGAELRSLLRREVWVATWLEPDPPNEFGYVDSWGTHARVFASQESIRRFLEWSGKCEDEVHIEKQAIDAEVLDGSN